MDFFKSKFRLGLCVAIVVLYIALPIIGNAFNLPLENSWYAFVGVASLFVLIAMTLLSYSRDLRDSNIRKCLVFRYLAYFLITIIAILTLIGIANGFGEQGVLVQLGNGFGEQGV